MKRLLTALSLIFICLLFASANSSSITAIKLLSKNKEYVYDLDKLTFLRTLCEDTIVFYIPTVSNIDMFTKEVPDTIWIKKRPKKNPKEGKHFKLSYIYKGNSTSSEASITPSSIINGKPFRVLSVDKVAKDYYTLYSDILIKLVDLDDLSVVNCLVPNNNNFSFSISSKKTEQEINSIIGNQFYVMTRYGYTSPKYSLLTVTGGEHSINFYRNHGGLAIRSENKLHFIDSDGVEIPINFEHPLYRNYNSHELIVGKEEYDVEHNARNINSDVNVELAKSNTILPFGFSYIWGTCDSHSAYISQQIVPDNINSYSWTSSKKKAPKDEVMFVGGSLIVRGVKFFKMIYNGKAFFVKANNIELSEENQAKLDSLENASSDIQNIFWHKTLLLNKAWYYKRIDEALKEVASYSQYGLAIYNWGVYDESEYTDGTGIQVTFLNPTDHVIKYVSITFQGYNAVDDKYGHTVTKKCVGPIDPNETAYYRFEYVWFSDVVEYAKIRSITVTYNNGTTKTISNPNSIMLSKNVIDTIFNSNPVEDFN